MSKRLDKLTEQLIESIRQFADAAKQEATDNAVALDICRERIKELEEKLKPKPRKKKS
jgi:uridine kinase